MTHGSYMITQFGPAEAMTWVSTTPGEPGATDIRLRHEAIGINYIDVYHRTGVYPLPLPSGLGVEGAGIVEAIGSAVTHLAVGDRVAYAGGPPGAYADVRMVPAARAVRLPDEVSSEAAAALFFKGLTAQYLIKSAYPVKAGETVLLHAAAGGVGQIASQWLHHLGASVIAVVGTPEKAALAKRHGAAEAIVDTDGTFAAKVRAIAPDGVDVVYDSVGKTTFAGSLDSLRVRGMMVSYGTASGPIPATDCGIFGAKGSLYFTRCSIAHYTARRDQLEAAAADLFDAIATGIVKFGEPRRYKLDAAVEAHRDLEQRRTTGSLLLIP